MEKKKYIYINENHILFYNAVHCVNDHYLHLPERKRATVKSDLC